MSEDDTRIGAAEAREALLSVSEMKEAGLRRGIPPRWLGIMLAIFMGGIAASFIAHLNGVTNALWISAWSVGMAAKRRALIVLARNMRTEMSLGVIAAQVAGVALLLGTLVAGRFAVPAIGRGPAALLGGGAAALVLYALFAFKRAAIRTKIEHELGR